MQPNIFQNTGDFVELGHFDKHFVKNTRKIDPTGKYFGECDGTRTCLVPKRTLNHLAKWLEFFLLDTLKTTS